VEAVEAGALRTGSGARVPADLVVWAAGATATPLARASGIATDEQGFVIVDGNLRSISHPAVFAAGDAATLSEAPELPRPGPYAARQGPVLAANLSALATGKPVTRFYRPRPDQLLLLSAGPGRAIFVRGRTALAAPWALRLKHFVDRRFVRRIGEHRGH
jgi:NADH dehydrogenase FAD-containing subunit